MSRRSAAVATLTAADAADESRRSAAMATLAAIDAADGSADGRLRAIDESIDEVDVQRLDYEISVVIPEVVDAIQREKWLFPETHRRNCMRSLMTAIDVMAHALRATDDPGMLAFMENRDMIVAYIDSVVANADSGDVRVFAISMAKAMGNMHDDSDIDGGGGGGSGGGSSDDLLAFAGAKAVFKFAEAPGGLRPKRLSMPARFAFMWFVLACLAIFALMQANRTIKIEQQKMIIAQRPIRATESPTDDPLTGAIYAASAAVAGSGRTLMNFAVSSLEYGSWALAYLSSTARPPTIEEQAIAAVDAPATDIAAVVAQAERMPEPTYLNAFLRMDYFAQAWTTASIVVPALMAGASAGSLLGMRGKRATRKVLYTMVLGGSALSVAGALYYRYNWGGIIEDEISARLDFGERFKAYIYGTSPYFLAFTALFGEGGRAMLTEQLRSLGATRKPGESTAMEATARRAVGAVNRLQIAGVNFLDQFTRTQVRMEDAVFEHNAAYLEWKRLKKDLPRTDRDLTDLQIAQQADIMDKMAPLATRMIEIRGKYNLETAALQEQNAVINSFISDHAEEIVAAGMIAGRGMAYGRLGVVRVTASQFMNTVENYPGLVDLVTDTAFTAFLSGKGAVPSTVLTNILRRIKDAQSKSTTPLSALDMSRIIIYDANTQELPEKLLDRLMARANISIQAGQTFRDFLLINGKEIANISTAAEMAAYRRAYIARLKGKITKEQKASITALAIQWRDLQAAERGLEAVDFAGKAAVGGIYGERLDPAIQKLEREFQEMLRGESGELGAGAGAGVGSMISASYPRRARSGGYRSAGSAGSALAFDPYPDTSSFVITRHGDGA